MSIYEYNYNRLFVDTQVPFYQAVLATAPVGYWRLGEASGAPQDLSGNAHHLTVSGTPTYGVAGWASDGSTGMTFDSTNCLLHADHAHWDMGTGDFSVMWVAKMASWPAADAQVFGHDGGGVAGEWEVYYRTALSGGIYASVSTANNYALTANTTSVMSDGAWHIYHVTWTRAGVANFYVDGIQQTTAPDISGTAATDLTNTSNLRLAGRGVGSRPFPGSLCELAIWNGIALSQSTISTLYASR